MEYSYRGNFIIFYGKSVVTATPWCIPPVGGKVILVLQIDARAESESRARAESRIPIIPIYNMPIPPFCYIPPNGMASTIAYV